jgi:pilus assembly protein CpaC
VNHSRNDRGKIHVAGARCWLHLLLAMIGLLAIVPLIGTTRAQEQQQVQVGGQKATAVRMIAGKSETIRTDRSFSDVIVSDPEIADVVPLTDRSLSILGKKVGTTRVSIYGDNKSMVGVFDVEVTYDTSMLATELRERFPGARFRVVSVNGKILLSGVSPDAMTVDKAVNIAKAFATPGPDNVINSVKVLAPQQVMLAVRFIEAERTAGRELGINWNVANKNINGTTGTLNPTSVTVPNPLLTPPLNPVAVPSPTAAIASAIGTAIPGLVSGNVPFGIVLGKILGNGFEIDAALAALESKGLIRRLAEPNLIALSGDTASFLAGGEEPIPVSQINGAVTVTWKQFGVQLAFTPTVLDNGVINLNMQPEVSQLDPANVVVISGTRIQGLLVRRANTTIELRDGQSFSIAGLLQTVNTNDVQQLPWLGDLPVLGPLFRSTSYQKQETDLAIIVTVHLVRPARPGDDLRTPLDHTVVGNDVDIFVDGRAELTPREVREVVPAARPLVKPTGHILDLPIGAPL